MSQTWDHIKDHKISLLFITTLILETIAILAASIWSMVDSVYNEKKLFFSSDNFYMLLVVLIMVWLLYFGLDAVIGENTVQLTAFFVCEFMLVNMMIKVV